MPEVLAALQIGLLGGLGLGQHGVGKCIRDAMGMDRDQARHLLGLRITETLGDARGLYAHARGAGQLEAHQLAVFSLVGLAARHGPLFQLLAIDRIDDAGAAGQGAEDAEQLASRRERAA